MVNVRFFQNCGGFGHSLLQLWSKAALAWRILRAHWVSLILLANWSSSSQVIPGFKYCFASGSDFSFS
jgi:hypothetical protein